MRTRVVTEAYVGKKERLKRVLEAGPQRLEEIFRASRSRSEFFRTLFKTTHNPPPEVLAMLTDQGLSLEELDFRKKDILRANAALASEVRSARHTPKILERAQLYFVEDCSVDPKSVRGFIHRFNKRMGWLEYKCCDCGNTGNHNGKKLQLQIDHRNGNTSDNRLSNLAFICPNCHAQTETFTAKNRKKRLPIS